MVNLQGKETTALKTIQQSLEDNLNIIPSDSRLKTISDKIADSRYTFKLLGETGTLPINNERPSFLVGDRLFVFGGNALGCGLIILDIKTMGVVKQVKISSTSITNLYTATFDEDYYYAGGSDLHQIIKGNVKTGEFIETKTISGLGAVHGVVVDNTYVYVITGLHKVYKLDKSLSVVQISDFNYINPISIEQDETFLYIGGNGHDSYNNQNAIIKVQKSNLTITNTSISNSSQIRKILVDGDHIVCGNSIGEIRIFQKSDLTLTSLVYSSPNGNAIRNIIKKLDFFWVGNNGGQTIVFSKDWIQKGVIQSGISDNYILEIDEYNKILYRNSNSDVTIAKYQIIDNLQNNTSTTAIKTTDLVTLNTAGTWVDTVYTLNDMSMTCNTLENGYLRQLSFTGTTTADSEFVLAVPNVNNKLTPNTSYILNGVKSTDSLSTVFIRLTQYQNPDGSGLSKITEKVAGDFKVFIAANDDYLYYKIEIVIKSGVTLSNSLYNNIPSMVPSSITYEQGEGPYLIKDLSEISNTIQAYKMTIIDGRLFVLPKTDSAGTIEVRDYQTGVLLKTIDDGSNVGVSGICFDADYIYIAKCVETITDKKYRDVYVRKYNRCTLDLVSESPILYTGVSGVSSTNSSNIFAMVENGDYLYLACYQNMSTKGVFHRIRKIKKTDFSQVAEITWSTPLNIIKHINGFFVLGYNDSYEKHRRIDFLDWDLNVIQTFPQTSLTIQNFRYGFYKGDYLYVENDIGVLVKYQISTNTIVAETQISEVGFIRNLVLINDNCILLQTNTSKIMLYDLNLNFIKMWDFYNTTTSGGHIISDNNNTIWVQSGSQPDTIYKKQFIDLTKGVI